MRKRRTGLVSTATALTRPVRRSTLRAMRIHLLLLATATAVQAAAQPLPTTPDFGPNVTIFDAATPAAAIQSKLDSIFASQESSEFGAGRYALLFKPGSYGVDARIGFYT